MSNPTPASRQHVGGDDEHRPPPNSTSTHPLAEPRAEAQRIIDMATASGLPLRVIGGVAVGVRCPSARQAPLARPYRDIDFVARSADGRRLTALFTKAGYEPDAEFNALHGRHRMFFWDPRNQREADVFLDRFAMCHTLDFRSRLELAAHTLPVSDLLLFKLQVMETNEKDYKDAIALLHDHPLTPDGLDAAYIARFLSADWGWWRTATLVLDRVGSYARELPLLSQHDRIADAISNLLETIDQQPKTGRWKIRAKIGERKRWYEIPEDARGATDAE
jgi:hypothetical protein